MSTRFKTLIDLKNFQQKPMCAISVDSGLKEQTGILTDAFWLRRQNPRGSYLSLPSRFAPLQLMKHLTAKEIQPISPNSVKKALRKAKRRKKLEVAEERTRIQEQKTLPSLHHMPVLYSRVPCVSRPASFLQITLLLSTST